MTDKIVLNIPVITDIEDLCRNSIDLIKYARGLAVRNINIIELMTNYSIGRCNVCFSIVSFLVLQ